MASFGFSLHIGINKIDPNHYAGSAGRLRGSEYDAMAMQAIAESMGFVNRILLTKDATRDRVITLIIDASKKLVTGDFLFISYSGHGGLLPNLNNDHEPVGYDQTWCLFDAQIVDDELRYLWTLFRPGVRILVVTDSCYSGTIFKLHNESVNHSKVLPPVVMKETYLKNQAFYDGILTQPYVPDEQINSSILLLASCQDDQESLDGPYNSVFTEHLLNVWNDGAFNGSYQNFVNEISINIRSTQIPQLKRLGIPDENFINNQPFKI